MYPTNYIVADLGFGDAGKGQVVHTLCGQHAEAGYPIATVVRYNGGCQAGHNVLDSRTGRWHTFSQFGSGTFHGAQTHLSRFMMVEPLSLGIEALSLRRESGIPNPLSMVTVEAGALVTTPYHWIVNRYLESERERQVPGTRHGSVGRGVGMTMAYALAWPDLALRFGDFLDPQGHLDRLQGLRRWCQEILSRDSSATYDAHVPDPRIIMEDQLEVMRHVTRVDESYLSDVLAAGNGVVFEGAQGVLLDQDFGFAPHTTWSNTTMGNADALLDAVGVDAFRLGVTRTYMVRHGPGPLPTEADLGVTDAHNTWGQWQGSVRTGHLDLPLLRYALRVATIDSSPRRPGEIPRVDGIALTHVDTALEHDLRIVDNYRLDGIWWDVPINARADDAEAQQERSRNLGQVLSSKRLSYAIGGPVKSWAATLTEALETPVVMYGQGPSDYHMGPTRVERLGQRFRSGVYDRRPLNHEPLFTDTRASNRAVVY